MADPDAKPAPGKKKLIVFGGLAVLLLVVGGGVAAMLLSGGGDEAANAATEAAPPAPVEAIYVSRQPEFVINFRARNTRPEFLKAEIAVATRDDTMEKAITRHMPAIRNDLVLLLSGQVYEDLVPNEGKEALRQQALATVQAVLEAQVGKPGVDDLYFANFVMH